ncbi:TfoX/Sxy family protein [Legionella rowbothamii]|uniref:TfoX/Sxy family protein n=1 Tax=Legionella rowbothamii TaxID=96229 RepID=UPI001054A4D1|nr:TfoX/Sxy family protein [Legionella rowbothamii]
MASTQSTIDFILDQIAGTGKVSAKKMFGEYAIYYNNKVVALVCDDQLFIKPTNAGKAFIKNYVEGTPYPNAKPHLLISADLWDEQEWLSHLIQITALEVPEPRKKVRAYKSSF